MNITALFYRYIDIVDNDDSSKVHYVVGTQKMSQWDGSFEQPKHMFKLMAK